MFPENLYSRTVINILLPEYHVVREASRLRFCTLNKLLLIRTRKNIAQIQRRQNLTNPLKSQEAERAVRSRLCSGLLLLDSKAFNFQDLLDLIEITAISVYSNSTTDKIWTCSSLVRFLYILLLLKREIVKTCFQ